MTRVVAGRGSTRRTRPSLPLGTFVQCRSVPSVDMCDFFCNNKRVENEVSEFFIGKTVIIMGLCQDEIEVFVICSNFALWMRKCVTKLLF